MWSNFQFVVVGDASMSSDYFDFVNNPVPQFQVVSFAWSLSSLPKVQADRKFDVIYLG